MQEESPKWMGFSNKLGKCILDGFGIVDSVLGQVAGGGGKNLKIPLVYFFDSDLFLACSPVPSGSR